MTELDKNEIDGIEAVDLDLYVKPIPTKRFKIKGTVVSIEQQCTNCKGQKQFKKYTNEGLQYGYICPKCNGTGFETITTK